MKKILLTAIIAMIGMSAFAEKPASGTKGYFYNPAAGMFLDSKGQLSATEGQEFEVYYKSSDAGDPASDYPDRGFDGGFYIRFKSSGDLCLQSYPLMVGGGYAQFIVRETEQGWLITHPYTNTGGNAPGWVSDDLDAFQGAYLQVVDGALVFAKDTENEGAYWQFIDADTYKKIAGPTYPIALTGGNAAVTVEVKEGTAEAPLAAVFTPSDAIQNVFQIKNLEVAEFIQYGYKKIVIEYAGISAGQFRGHAYGNGQTPHWDIASGEVDGDAPWLAFGENKFEVELVADVIEDYTIFSWFGGANVPIEITACYFSKEEVGATEPEEPEEPVAIVFPQTGAKGYLFNLTANKFYTADNTLGTEGLLFTIKNEGTAAGKFNWGSYSYTDDPNRTFDIVRFETDMDVPETSSDAGKGKTRLSRGADSDDGLTATMYNGWSKWPTYYEEGKGLLLFNMYQREADVNCCGYCLSFDGENPVLVPEAEATYWKFVTEDEYEEYEAIATSIASVSEKASAKGIFNVAGQQIKALQKGLNIVDGKKIYVK